MYSILWVSNFLSIRQHFPLYSWYKRGQLPAQSRFVGLIPAQERKNPGTPTDQRKHICWFFKRNDSMQLTWVPYLHQCIRSLLRLLTAYLLWWKRALFSQWAPAWSPGLAYMFGAVVSILPSTPQTRLGSELPTRYRWTLQSDDEQFCDSGRKSRAAQPCNWTLVLIT